MILKVSDSEFRIPTLYYWGILFTVIHFRSLIWPHNLFSIYHLICIYSDLSDLDDDLGHLPPERGYS